MKNINARVQNLEELEGMGHCLRVRLKSGQTRSAMAFPSPKVFCRKCGMDVVVAFNKIMKVRLPGSSHWNELYYDMTCEEILMRAVHQS